MADTPPDPLAALIAEMDEAIREASTNPASTGWCIDTLNVIRDRAATLAARPSGDEALRQWATFHDEDGVWRIVTTEGDDVSWPEMGEQDCDRAVDEHNAAVRAARPSGDEALRAALDGLRRSVIALKHNIPRQGELPQSFYRLLGDVNVNLDKAEAALAAPVSPSPDETATDYARRYNRRAGVLVEPPNQRSDEDDAAYIRSKGRWPEAVSPSPDVEGLREAVIRSARAFCTDWAGDPDFGAATDNLTDAITALDAALAAPVSPSPERVPPSDHPQARWSDPDNPVVEIMGAPVSPSPESGS